MRVGPLAPGASGEAPTLLATITHGGTTWLVGTSQSCGSASPIASRTHRPRSRATVASRGRSSTAGPTAWRAHLLDGGAEHQDKVALYLYNCPGVHGGCLRGLQGRAGAGQHELPLPRRRARLPVGQRRRDRGDLPRQLHRAGRGGPGSPAEGASLAVGRRRQPGPVPGLGGVLRGGGRHRDRAGRRAVGPLGRRHPHDLHRRHHRHAQGRDVAPGRPDPCGDRGRRRRRSPRTPRSSASTPRSSPCRARAFRVCPPAR